MYWFVWVKIDSDTIDGVLRFINLFQVILTKAIRKITSFRMILVLLISLCCLSGALAQSESIYEDVPEGKKPFPSWRFEGEFFFSGERYDVLGNRAQAAYPDLGEHGFADFDLFGNYNKSRYERVQMQLSGTGSASRYRNNQIDGLILERGSIFWEKGDAPVAFRAEAGDFFGDVSLRTLQVGLKGVQIEVQPNLGIPGVQTSFLSFAGITPSNYNLIDVRDDFYAGASMLISAGEFDLSFNSVYNHRRDGQAGRTGDSHQIVSSVALERGVSILDQALTFESEAAHFYGENSFGPGVGRNSKHDYGVYSQLSGNSRTLPLNYSLLYERYGNRFTPAGGAVSPDRRTYEARASWRFKDGLIVRARGQRFEDGIESVNPNHTHVGGLDLIGPVYLPFLKDRVVTASINNFATHARTTSGSSKTLTYVSNANFSTQLTESVTGLLGGGYTRTDNLLTLGTSETFSASTGIDTYFDYHGFNTRVGTSVLSRRTRSTGTNRVDEIGPRLSLDIGYGGHSLSADYSVLYQKNFGFSRNDTWNHTAAGYYTYTKGAHKFGAEVDYYGRARSPGTNTDSFRFGLNYTYRFALPKRDVADAQIADSSVGDTDLLLLNLSPGLRTEIATTRLGDAGISTYVKRGSALVYDVSWLPDIAQRQRLVLEVANGRVARSALLISFTDQDNGAGAERLYRRVLDEFIGNYGSPSVYEEGRFGPEFGRAVNNSQLIRIAEWRLPNGVLRMGIPNRLDRVAQIEVHYAPSFQAVQNTQWGLDRIR